ncbi:hypothetical protein HMPREF0080_01531 [Anaeroglobus geminatus F0357]|uniref:Uncharacterized protein n=1 Tax=Anaeroglobus geminatus F0357 TaxID=861450 RepID=G9YIN7_9FIRM|nr:hypothetical protein HMPREF0080_01531 [Anaeroglobus geminatus F0357]
MYKFTLFLHVCQNFIGCFSILYDIPVIFLCFYEFLPAPLPCRNPSCTAVFRERALSFMQKEQRN